MAFTELLVLLSSTIYASTSALKLLAAAAVLIIIYSSWPGSHPFLRVGKPWLLSFLSGRDASTFTMEKHIQEGYIKANKAMSQPFVMKWWAMDYIFLPPKYLADIKRANAHSLSFFENISNAISLYASVGDLYSSDIMVDVVRKGINTRLPNMVSLLWDECDYAFVKEIGSGSDWTPFTTVGLISRIMHRTTSRVLIGHELCRNETFIRTSLTFTGSIFVNGLVLSMLPLGPFRRPLSYAFSVIHRRNLQAAMDIVLPVVAARFDEFESREQSRGLRGSVADGEVHKRHLDAIEWTLEFSRDKGTKEHNPNRIALSLLHNLWAGSAAPAGLVTQMLFQALLDPPARYLDTLRAEAERAITLYGRTDDALRNMPMLDSFIHEVNRLYPTGAATCARSVMDPCGFTFHDGLKLPVGARIAIPALAIQTDADNFDHPLEFDGFRFARLSDEKADEMGEQTWSASTVSETNLAFGFGKHSCPGRFYAVRKTKMIFSKLIMDYDVIWDNRSIPKTMPERLSVNGQFAPNQWQKILLRRRADFKG